MSHSSLCSGYTVYAVLYENELEVMFVTARICFPCTLVTYTVQGIVKVVITQLKSTINVCLSQLRL